MVKAEAEKGANIGFLKHVVRKITTTTLSSTILRSETFNNHHGIDKAKEALRQGFGLIVIINHFSLKDPPLTINEIFKHNVMGSKKITAPIAYHVDKPSYHEVGKLIDVTFSPIVTENTVKKGKHDGREKSEGKQEYLNASLDILRLGGIVILAPQGERKGTLGEPNESIIVGTIIAYAKKRRIEKFAFLFMGLGIEGVNDYSEKKVRGLNLFKKYNINIGACLTNQELMKKAGGNYREVGRIVYEELDKIVPSNYK